MKELPGLPELPEGWFYRVKSRRYGTSGSHRQYTLEVHRPLFWGLTIGWESVTVLNSNGFDFHPVGDSRLSADIVRASERFSKSEDDSIEGDYR